MLTKKNNFQVFISEWVFLVYHHSSNDILHVSVSFEVNYYLRLLLAVIYIWFASMEIQINKFIFCYKFSKFVGCLQLNKYLDFNVTFYYSDITF